LLFTIRATIVASGSNNAKVDLVEAVYGPWVATPDATGDTALLNNQCGGIGWPPDYKNPEFLTATVTSTLEAGSPEWPTGTTPLGVSLGGVSAWSGNYSGFESSCAPVIMTLPGTIHGVMPVPSVNTADGNEGWAQMGGGYGFMALVDDDQAVYEGSHRITYTSCTITLGAVAQADSLVSAWKKVTGYGGYTNGSACEYDQQH
jgi:hypothetical protein